MSVIVLKRKNQPTKEKQTKQGFTHEGVLTQNL